MTAASELPRPWCPVCRHETGDVSYARAYVQRVKPLTGPRGAGMTPWDSGGWRCQCGLAAPGSVWAVLIVALAKGAGIAESEYMSEVEKAQPRGRR